MLQDYAEDGESDRTPNTENYTEAAEGVDSNFENDFDIGYGDRLINARPDGAYDEDQTPWQERTARETTLQEMLESQIDIAFSKSSERLLAAKISEHLDASGWFTANTEQLAEEVGVTEDILLQVLNTMQGFEPAGIFARNLAECLEIQLTGQGRLDPKIQTLIQNLPLLAEGKVKKLMKLCQCDEELLREMVADIRRLDPKPAAGYDLAVNAHIIPDVFVRPDGEGSWIVELNQDNIPSLLLDRNYYARAVEGASETIDKEYLTKQFQNAQWLRKALNQRNVTILKVATTVINHQSRFLEHGVSALEPLVLQQVADLIEMHPSTVSRATNGKYISTPRGVFELKYLFQTAIESNNPNVRFSAEAIRYRIKTLINEEDPAQPIADDALSEILNGEGIRLARRTIAKYREDMNIPSSSKRKRLNRSLF